jgi:hypothetical protein
MSMIDPTPELNKALAAVQARLPKIGKGEEGKVSGVSKSGKSYEYTYKYADLSGISPAILPILGEEGLAWTTRPTMEDGHFVLLYELRHASGEAIGGMYPLHAGGPQDMGKEITYARRYALCAVTGIAPGDDDDDGASAQRAAAKPLPAQAERGKARAAAKKTAEPEPRADTAAALHMAAQRKKYHALRNELGWTEEMGHAFIEDTSRGRFTRWSDLDERGRGIILDAMQREHDDERIPPPEDGPMVPDNVDRETGEVRNDSA